MKVILFAYLSVFALSCGAPKAIDSTNNKGEVLIDLKKGIEAAGILSEFEPYDLSYMKTVSPELNIGLYSFNSSKISIDELIEKLLENDDVENAQSNKKIKPRN